MPHLVTRGMAFGLHVSYEVPSVSIRGLHLCRQCPLKLKLESSMAPVPITEDYYLMLEVEQTATSELIARSYKRLALKLHPDRNSKHNATEAFQLVWQSTTSVQFSD
jgi:hypothetical protein